MQEFLTLVSNLCMIGTRLFPWTDLGIGNPASSQAVGNMSTNSTIDELRLGELSGDLIIRGTRVTSSSGSPFAKSYVRQVNSHDHW